MISIFDLAALLLTLSALFGWLNRRFLPLPHAIGLLVMGLLASLALVALDLAFPQQHLYEDLTGALKQIDFTEVVMNGMLAFLLFAGALNLNLQALRERAWPVATLALVGTAVSTVVVGLAVWGVSQALGHPLPLAWAFVFGALISPTDPVAVLATLKNVQVPQALEVEMQGEALFNDGVGVVLFTVLLGFAAGGGGERGALGIAELLLVEAGGGILLGLVTGYVAYRAMRAIDDFSVEVLITLALVTGTYALAQKLGTSGPLAVVAAGLLVGERGPRDAMSERTQGYVSALWTLIDEVLNSVLFLLIGLEVLVLRFDASALWLAAAAVPLVILGRGVAVSVPLLLFRWSDRLSARNVPFLTWAGVRGGISVALALSVPEGEHKPALLAATYAVVLFSIIVQGSTLGMVARRTVNGARGSHNTPAPL
ncbi:cation:proton antiporter [Methylorubrum extorquens]|uniref:Sodium/hydrogen exchanger n=1 Tax=Methylorubrum extorquens (strain ATCC 14718 / DSM 1338 / JCM 2805 / NCIMB 9133 / AM1) TaxID=272630 RepID=C5B621_METEA|nr:sodium:proton antiporter [Methylorubrum extorquens]ACS43903.1 putative sodium/hydrogen exchanger [Methylorubrum extorquens AM1]MCP1546246.1 CPA1 family monovalent cation:H+ antiporter [Methylorubrum extorquens]MCP1590913.1 CPA1 family monovalent cation:H+ antiporter [Methylorubrum extorquens]